MRQTPIMHWTAATRFLYISNEIWKVGTGGHPINHGQVSEDHSHVVEYKKWEKSFIPSKKERKYPILFYLLFCFVSCCRKRTSIRQLLHTTILFFLDNSAYWRAIWQVVRTVVLHAVFGYGLPTHIKYLIIQSILTIYFAIICHQLAYPSTFFKFEMCFMKGIHIQKVP